MSITHLMLSVSGPAERLVRVGSISITIAIEPAPVSIAVARCRVLLFLLSVFDLDLLVGICECLNIGQDVLLGDVLVRALDVWEDLLDSPLHLVPVVDSEK